MTRLLLALGIVLGFGIGGLAPSVGVAHAEPAAEYVQSSKPAGFWGSGVSRGKGSYRWKLLYVGVGIAAVAGVVMWRLTRRANAEREQRRNDPWPRTR
jgi:hypothetical protein